MLTQTASMHIQHMQKALQQMNLLLHNVVSDITGVTGMKIIEAILAGERDPRVLARNRDERCRNTTATIAKSLVGNYREEHLFALRQAVDLYETYRPRLLIVTRRLSISSKRNPTCRTMSHRQQTNAFRLATAFVMALMSTSCYSKKAVSICLPFLVWRLTLCLPWPAKSALT